MLCTAGHVKRIKRQRKHYRTVIYLPTFSLDTVCDGRTDTPLEATDARKWIDQASNVGGMEENTSTGTGSETKSSITTNDQICYDVAPCVGGDGEDATVLFEPLDRERVKQVASLKKKQGVDRWVK